MAVGRRERGSVRPVRGKKAREGGMGESERSREREEGLATDSGNGRFVLLTV